MLDVNPFRKNKIKLSDYDFERDIKNRIMLSEMSPGELIILEEILYNPVRFPISRLLKSLDLTIEEIQPTIERLGLSGLFTLDGDTICVNKEMRKYFEAEIVKYEEDFSPDMDHLQNLLKKVPIHVLPTWYHIPRTSNNIFESLVEKYLLTPQIFERYLMELNFGDDTLNGIAQDVLQAPNFTLTADQIKSKYNLDKVQFEEAMLHLEFNFVCCLSARKEGNQFEQIVTPFFEWGEYLHFIRTKTPKSLKNSANIHRRRPHDFSFIEDITELVKLCKEGPISLTESESGSLILEKRALDELQDRLPSFTTQKEFIKYVEKLIAKSTLLNLTATDNMILSPLEEANFWLTLSTENRALRSYKTLYVHLITMGKHFNERNLREWEKSLCKILDLGWITFDDFMKGVTIPLSDESKIALKKVGRKWRYTLPSYTDEETELIKTHILDWLFEAGLIALGQCDDALCFSVTELGKNIFNS